MKDLVLLFRDAGCLDARTYIQSGNVIFQAEKSLVRELPARIAEALTKRFGFESPVVMRTVEDLQRTVRKNPFLREGADPQTLHVAFLASQPSPARVASLDPGRSPTDRFEIDGREIYLHCPDGFGRTKLTNQYFDSKLGTTSTIRNWKTVLKLLELAEG